MIFKAKKIIIGIIIFIITLNFFGYIYDNKEVFLSKFNSIEVGEKYQQSQWASGWYATTQMSDAENHSWSGWNLIQGRDPELINKEKPIFAKYFIGLSILVFKNENVVSIFWGIGVLIASYLLAKLFLMDSLWALFLPLVLSFEPLFREQLITSLLDLPFTFFILMSVWALIRGFERNNFLYFSAISLGLAGASKVFLLCPLFGGLYGTILFFSGRKKEIIKLGILVFVVYLLVNLQYFFFHSLKDFLYLHFWVIWFSRNIVPNYPSFQIWRLLFLGQWLSWKPHPPEIWFDLIFLKISQYTLFWTMGTILFFLQGISSFKRKNLPGITLFLIVLTYLTFWSFAPPFPRYLLAILPLIYVIALLFVKNIIHFLVLKKTF